MFTSILFSHCTALSDAEYRSLKVPVNFLCSHSLTMWCIVYATATPWHLRPSFMRHWCIRKLHRPWPVRIRFNLVHNLRGRDDLGWTVYTSLTKSSLIGWFLFQSFCHEEGLRCLLAFIVITLFRDECWDLCLSFSTPYSWIRRVVLHAIFSATFNTAFCLLIWGDSMLARTGSHCICVGLNVPEIIRMAFHSSTSTELQ